MNYLCTIMALDAFSQICSRIRRSYRSETRYCFVNLLFIINQMSQEELFKRIQVDKAFFTKINRTDTIADIKDIFPDAPLLSLPSWLFVVLLAGFVLFAFWFVMNLRRKGLPPVIASPIEARIRDNMHVLSKTSQEDYCAPIFYATLHKVLLDMLSEKFQDSRYCDSVSPDIHSFLERQTEAPVSEQLEELLSTIQMVKFAGFRPDIYSAFEDLAKAKTILDSLINTEPLISKYP